MIIKQLKIAYKNKIKKNLKYNTPFELIISVLLSCQSRDEAVNKSTKKLYKIANTPEKMLDLGEENIKKYIKNIGLFNIKAKNIIKLSKILIYKFNKIIPNKRKDLESLPGIGRKCSNIILNTIFKKKTIAVDTHVFRVCNRTKFAIGNKRTKVELKLKKFVPNNFKLIFHNLFIFHGKNICTAKKLYCKICSINKFCEFEEKIT